MRLATFRPRDAPARLGAVLDTGQVVDLAVAGDRYLSTGERRNLDSAFQTLIAFLETGERAVQAARTIVVRVQEQIARGGGTLEGAYPLEDVRFLAPLSRPGKNIAVGLIGFIGAGAGQPPKSFEDLEPDQDDPEEPNPTEE